MQRAHAEPPPPLPVVARRSLISTGTAARLAGCHPTTVWRAIERGELQAFRLGANGDFRLRAEALDAWLTPAAGRDNPKETS